MLKRSDMGVGRARVSRHIKPMGVEGKGRVSRHIQRTGSEVDPPNVGFSREG